MLSLGITDDSWQFLIMESWFEKNSTQSPAEGSTYAYRTI